MVRNADFVVATGAGAEMAAAVEDVFGGVADWDSENDADAPIPEIDLGFYPEIDSDHDHDLYSDHDRAFCLDLDPARALGPDVSPFPRADRGYGDDHGHDRHRGHGFWDHDCQEHPEGN